MAGELLAYCTEIMKKVGDQTWRVMCVLAVVFLFLGAMGAALGGADEEGKLALLPTRLGTFTNVTITARSDTKLTIMHEGGIGEVFYEDLDPDYYEAVGYEPPVAASDRLRSVVSQEASRMKQMMQSGEETSQGVGGEIEITEIDPLFFGIALFVGLVIYLFSCYCYMLICRKAGTEPGIMVWIPILQVFPLLKAAGMSPWWVLGFLVPLLNIIVSIMWCFKIVSARGKSLVWAVLLILPLTNLIAFLYLAFSSGNEMPSAESSAPRGTGFMVR